MNLNQFEVRIFDLGLRLASLYAEEERENEAGQLHSGRLEGLVRRMDDIAGRIDETVSNLATLQARG